MSLDPILVQSPTQFPGQCIDGSQGTPNEPVVDTHIEIQGVGRIYLSRRTVRDAARLFGMVERAELVAVQEQNLRLDARVVELETELAEAQPILSAMARASARYGIDD